MIATHELVGMRDSLVRVARKDARTHTLQWKEVCTCPEAAALCLFMHCRRRHQVQPPRYHAFIVLRATAAHTNTHNYTLNDGAPVSWLHAGSSVGPEQIRSTQV